MDDSTDMFTQNIPEMLAQDLAMSEGVFRTKTLTAGAPALSLASESPPPEVPRRNPSRVATNMLHRATSDTALCSRQDSAKGITDTAKGHQQCGCADKGAMPRHCSDHNEGLYQRMNDQYNSMVQENDKGKTRLFLNGSDEDWGSVSSVDAEAGRSSSPSVRVRKQSVTTAATSIEAQSLIGAGAGRVGCASPSQNLVNRGARIFHNGSESWVDLGTDMMNFEEDVGGAEVPIRAAEYTAWPNSRPAPFANDDGPEELCFVNVPRRRSSLSHHVTTVVLGDTAHTCLSPCPSTPGQELSSQTLLLSSSEVAPCPPTPPFHNPQDWAYREVAGSPVAPTSPRQASCKSNYALKETLQDQQRPASPHVEEATHNALNTSHRKQQQRPNLLNKLRKTQSHSKMHILTHVQSWLDSDSATRPDSTTVASPSSPTGMTSLTSIRVPAEVLENLRISVGNFPDTMLRTSSLTVQTIRSYSRKLKRGGIGNNDRFLARESDEIAFDAPNSPQSVYVSGLDRQSSFGNLRLKGLSLRGRLNISSRLPASPTSPSLKGNDDFWRDFDHRYPSTRSNTPPSRKSHSEVSACVAALRSIFPNGTDYLLDALYAHVIAFNYINSLCGGLPHLQNDGGQHPLHARPSTNFAVPLGVTSRADLKLQDPDDSMIRDFEDDVASVASTAVVPKKAASLLGLGATNMGKPVKPRPGTLGGRKTKHRKTTPPAASFSASLESESAMRDLRDAVAVNIQQLVGTVKSASASALAHRENGEESEDGVFLRTSARELEPSLMRALCEVVRCYEELS